ncbi:MAG: Gfo/Idh/MocA family oxidoreductase [Chthoniobacterales bacterium]
MFNPEVVRFGFIGAGMIAHHSAKTVHQHPRGRVTAVYDTNPVRASELAGKQGAAKVCSSVEQMLADPEIDAVYIAVPNKFHAGAVVAALEAGKHVLVEKPLAMNAVEGAAMLAAARASGRTFLVGMNQRYAPSAQTIHAAVAAGEAGEIYHAKAYWWRRSGIPKLGTWFTHKALAGAGACNDIGVHALDVCLFMMGNFEPVTVSGATYAKFGPRGLGEGGWGQSDREHTDFDVDDFATAFIRMRNGATVTLDAVWASHCPDEQKFGVELYGTEGGFSLDPLQFRHAGSDSYLVEESLQRPLALPHGDRFHNLINHLLEGEELLVKPAQALVVQKILDAINESARTGREVVMA